MLLRAIGTVPVSRTAGTETARNGATATEWHRERPLRFGFIATDTHTQKKDPASALHLLHLHNGIRPVHEKIEFSRGSAVVRSYSVPVHCWTIAFSVFFFLLPSLYSHATRPCQHSLSRVLPAPPPPRRGIVVEQQRSRGSKAKARHRGALVHSLSDHINMNLSVSTLPYLGSQWPALLGTDVKDSYPDCYAARAAA